MLEVYSDLQPDVGAVRNDNSSGFLVEYWGTYSGSASALFDIFAFRPVTVLAFVKTGDAATISTEWIGKLKDLYNDTTIDNSKVFFGVVLHNDALISLPVFNTYMNNNYPGWNSTSPIPFALLRATAWVSTDSVGPHYLGGVDTGYTQPVTYIISRSGTSPSFAYYITDKVHFTAGSHNGRTGDTLFDSSLFTLDTLTGAASDSDHLKAFIAQRIKDIVGTRTDASLGNPTVTVHPDTRDTSDPGGIALMGTGSQVRFTFSEKAVGAGNKSNYLFTEGANQYTNLFSSIKGEVPDTDLTPPDGLKASEYLAPSSRKESWVATFTDLIALGFVGKTITFDPSQILDGSHNAFTLDAANTSPLQFKVTADAILPVVSTLASGTASGYYKAGSAIDVKVTFNKNVTLSGGHLILTLNTVPAATLALAPEGPGSELSGIYTVAAGQNTPAGAPLNVTAITLEAGASLRDEMSRPVDLSVPQANISAGSQIYVDTVAPTVLSATARLAANRLR